MTKAGSCRLGEKAGRGAGREGSRGWKDSWPFRAPIRGICPKSGSPPRRQDHGKGTGIPSRSGMSPSKECSRVIEGDIRLGME